ncbi:hypothetical protein [Burkholderia gladioli]|uniref:hypothetical protein n=1 Tax=Burkholderia gladioli TaxID=28095 RepID=UPI0012FD1B4C|nr:hypothetical protein [Burkholderia gladioli]
MARHAITAHSDLPAAAVEIPDPHPIELPRGTIAAILARMRAQASRSAANARHTLHCVKKTLHAQVSNA